MKFLHFPLTLFVCCFIIGIIIEHHFHLPTQLPTYVIISGILLFAFATICSKLTKSITCFQYIPLLCALFLGITCQKLQNKSNHKEHYTHFEKVYSTYSHIQISIKEKIKSNGYTDNYIVFIHSINGKKANGKILLKIKKEGQNLNLQSGKAVLINGKIDVISKAKNPFQFDYGTYLKNKNIFGQIKTSKSKLLITKKITKNSWYYAHLFREKIITKLNQKGLNDESLPIATALLLGQRHDINPDIVKEYQNAGATHILAVSGLHVGFIMLFFGFLLKQIPNQFGIAKLLILLAILSGFAIVTGLSPSILRATIMFSFIAIADYLKRPTNIYHTLLLSAFFILLFDSNSLYDVGFQLSYCAVFFIVWMQPLFKSIYTSKNKIITNLIDSFGVTLAAQIGTLPVTLYYFHQFPGLFLITNLVVIPLVSVIMFVGILTIILAVLGILPELLVWLLKVLIEFLNQFVAWIAHFKQFVFTDISFSIGLLLASYLFIFTFILFCKNKKIHTFIYCVIALISLQSIYIYQKYEQENGTELILFNDYKNTIISLKKGTEITLYSPNKINYLNWNIHNYMTQHSYKIQARPFVNFIYHNQSKIMVIDSSSVYLKNVNPDVLLLVQSPKINLERVIEETRPKQVLADYSNYTAVIQKWKKTCTKLKIPFHATNEIGFYRKP
ncbi:ComEC/Rec2 family competence protein [Flavobacterium agrisoli]|uniref:ComEC family competence protein n=1 Tax=Flavobacterium agrisoli TaxID=2793066 RepID=A0A934PM26_9FLAO|nr:ComEC/Rec2 family competence protein [Flavobacterium agrisoli]MBK0370676.1 ComEC family competence protein [Flavobacterium agrisoli]